ncbi:MAG TPA: hypothetical protein VD948_01795, partial [Rhodothermales bacterium]|nr:hypothetical protein [Rhodothermales bacterium]
MYRRRYLAVLLAFSSLSLSACNVFEGVTHESGLTDDIEVLLVDGQRALARGDAPEAVRIFTHAVEITRLVTYEGRVARIKLATAKLLEQRLSLLDFQELAIGVVSALNDLPSAPRTDLDLGPVCSYAAPDVAYDQIFLR